MEDVCGVVSGDLLETCVGTWDQSGRTTPTAEDVFEDVCGDVSGDVLKTWLKTCLGTWLETCLGM